MFLVLNYVAFEKNCVLMSAVLPIIIGTVFRGIHMHNPFYKPEVTKKQNILLYVRQHLSNFDEYLTKSFLAIKSKVNSMQFILPCAHGTLYF